MLLHHVLELLEFFFPHLLLLTLFLLLHDPCVDTSFGVTYINSTIATGDSVYLSHNNISVLLCIGYSTSGLLDLVTIL